MTKYLLDTHILLWSLLDPSNLSDNVTTELNDDENELWLSPITTWEILILAEKDRIYLNTPPVEWLNGVFNALPFHEATVNQTVAMRSRTISLPHQDPADRFIAASAIVYGLTLVTSDHHLISGAGDYTVLAN